MDKSHAFAADTWLQIERSYVSSVVFPADRAAISLAATKENGRVDAGPNEEDDAPTAWHAGRLRPAEPRASVR